MNEQPIAWVCYHPQTETTIHLSVYDGNTERDAERLRMRGWEVHVVMCGEPSKWLMEHTK